MLLVNCFNLDLIRDTSIACLFTGFASTFVNSGLLALVTPLSLEFFGWKGFENNIYLLGLACVVSYSFNIIFSNPSSLLHIFACF